MNTDTAVKIFLWVALIGIILWVAIGAKTQGDSGERCTANDGSIYGSCQH
jgi:hypothetical protein